MLRPVVLRKPPPPGAPPPKEVCGTCVASKVLSSFHAVYSYVSPTVSRFSYLHCPYPTTVLQKKNSLAAGARLGATSPAGVANPFGAPPSKSEPTTRATSTSSPLPNPFGLPISSESKPASRKPSLGNPFSATSTVVNPFGDATSKVGTSQGQGINRSHAALSHAGSAFSPPSYPCLLKCHLFPEASAPGIYQLSSSYENWTEFRVGQGE
jgi:hypothetical protein